MDFGYTLIHTECIYIHKKGELKLCLSWSTRKTDYNSPQNVCETPLGVRKSTNLKSSCNRFWRDQGSLFFSLEMAKQNLLNLSNICQTQETAHFPHMLKIVFPHKLKIVFLLASLEFPDI